MHKTSFGKIRKTMFGNVSGSRQKCCFTQLFLTFARIMRFLDLVNRSEWWFGTTLGAQRICSWNNKIVTWFCLVDTDGEQKMKIGQRNCDNPPKSGSRTLSHQDHFQKELLSRPSRSQNLLLQWKWWQKDGREHRSARKPRRDLSCEYQTHHDPQSAGKNLKVEGES